MVYTSLEPWKCLKCQDPQDLAKISCWRLGTSGDLSPQKVTKHAKMHQHAKKWSNSRTYFWLYGYTFFVWDRKKDAFSTFSPQGREGGACFWQIWHQTLRLRSRIRVDLGWALLQFFGRSLGISPAWKQRSTRCHGKTGKIKSNSVLYLSDIRHTDIQYVYISTLYTHQMPVYMYSPGRRPATPPHMLSPQPHRLGWPAIHHHLARSHMLYLHAGLCHLCTT